ENPNLQSMLKKIGQEITHLFNLLNEMEQELHQQEKQKHMLEELQKCVERQLNEAQHLRENIPRHLPKPTQSCIIGLTVQCGEQTKAVEPECTKRPMKEPRAIKEVPLITVEEFNEVP
ncbi:SKA1 protein, partial [Crotophaga sulcirostris]|nr:SKA1 protein [Crotophaga sulcirostris]